MAAAGNLSSALTPTVAPVQKSPGLSHKVLLLDTRHRPLAAAGDERMGIKPLQIPATSALEAMANGKVYAVDFTGDYVHGKNGEYLPVPTVVALAKPGLYDYLSRPVLFTLKRLYIRDGATCQYSGERVVIDPANSLYKNPKHRGTFDHVVPRSRGGATGWENALLASEFQNTAKANLPPERFTKPLSEPWLPTQADLLRLWLTDERLLDVPQDWLEHIDRTPLTTNVRRHMDRICDTVGSDLWSWQRDEGALGRAA
jgi:hypothetical protein